MVALVFLYSALFFGANVGLYTGLWIGFLAGVSSPDPVGSHMLAFSLVGHILGKHAKILKKELWPVQILIVFISALMLDIFCLLFLFILENQHINLNILNNILLKSFYICIYSFFIFYIFKKFKRILL
jgi:rod shape-determining protein MreD